MYTKKIIGHKRQLELLNEDMKLGGLPHAYLFYGPSHIGKFSIAKNMALELQCKNGLCLKCPDCKQFLANSHLDVLVYPENDEKIRIEDVRKIIHRVNVMPQSNYFVCIIQNIERMTREASNAFLKTLEEPPLNVIFFLTTKKIKKILPTIISRVRLMQFYLVPDELIETFYKSECDQKFEFDLLAHFVNGRPGRLMNMIKEDDSLDKRRMIFEEVRKILENKDIIERFQYVDSISKNKKEIKRFLGNMIYFLREKILEEGAVEKKRNLKYIELVRKVEEIKEFIDQNVNTKLALETLMIEI